MNIKTFAGAFLLPLAAAALPVVVSAQKAPAPAQQVTGFRPPAVPLVTHDPLFSIWSPSDKLYGSTPRHCRPIS